jgi:hypothetical protein
MQYHQNPIPTSEMPGATMVTDAGRRGKRTLPLVFLLIELLPPASVECEEEEELGWFPNVVVVVEVGGLKMLEAAAVPIACTLISVSPGS